MKASVFFEHGGPEKLLYREVPDPVVGFGEVRLQVRACALNHLDLWVLQGIPAYHTTLPHILGSDLSGVVEEVGKGVEGIRTGDPVFVAPGISCFRCDPCLSGQDNLCRQYRIVGAGTDGGYAEKVVVPARNVLPLPEGLSFEEAAAFPLTFLTAWHMLIDRARLQPGETLLVLAGGSGVGSAAVQIAKVAGARVLATAGTEEKCKRVEALGADEAINDREEDVAAAVKRMTDGRGVDVVFEHVGPSTWERSIQSLVKGGRLVTCGATSGPKVELDLRYLFSRQLTVLGSIMGTRAELMKISRLLAQGRFRPVIDSVFPLSEARAAQKKMADRHLFGKIVLRPD